MSLLTTYTQGRYTEQTFDFLKNELAKLPASEQVALAGKLSRANRYDSALDPSVVPGGCAGSARDAHPRPVQLAQLLDAPRGDEGREARRSALMMLRARAAWRDDQPQDVSAGTRRGGEGVPRQQGSVDAKIQRAKYYTTDVLDYARAVDNLTKAIDAGVGAERREPLEPRLDLLALGPSTTRR